MAPGPPTNVPGQMTISVRVPYRVVGLVVGPKGATIKRIQQQSQTYIVTPSRDKEPVFEVTGLPDSVETARKEIESHIAMRTGVVYDDEAAMSAFAASHNLSLDTMLSSPEIMGCFRAAQQQAAASAAAAALAATSQLIQPSTSAGTLNNTSSLNALLSNAGSSSQLGLGSSHLGYSSLNNAGQYNTNGFGSSSSFGQSGLNSLSNGFGNLNSLGVNGLTSSSLSNMIQNTMINSTSSQNNQTNNYSSVNGLGTLGLGGSSSNLNSGYSNFLSTLENQTNRYNSDANNFSLLGEATNNLLNTHKNNAFESTLFPLGRSSSGNNFASAPTTSTSASALPYGVDEGLGSLESSMGSSPALDQQPQTQNIWGHNTGGNLPNFSFPSHSNIMSGESTPNHRMSPLLGDHLQRSNSDPARLSALTVALSNLSSVGTMRSNSGSPELGDITSKMAPLSVMGANSLPCSGSALKSPIATPTVTDATNILAGLVSSSVNDALAEAMSSSRRASPDTKVCCTCHSGENVTAAIIPCGHNQLCMDCANKLVAEGGDCPSCQQKIEKVIQIRS